MGRSCTLSEVESFIRAAVPGAVLVYFTADNIVGYDGLDLCLKQRSNPMLRGVVNRIRLLANAGRIDLVQARDRHRTQYRAIWRAHPCPLPVELRLEPVPA